MYGWSIEVPKVLFVYRLKLFQLLTISALRCVRHFYTCVTSTFSDAKKLIQADVHFDSKK